jgi:hypothetical protein
MVQNPVLDFSPSYIPTPSPIPFTISRRKLDLVEIFFFILDWEGNWMINEWETSGL